MQPSQKEAEGNLASYTPDISAAFLAIGSSPVNPQIFSNPQINIHTSNFHSIPHSNNTISFPYLCYSAP
jgi:hypothetical protein